MTTETYLPVYQITRTGIDEKQAKKLAEALKIPTKGLRWLDGEASFVDRDKYLAVPSVRIEDPDIVARFTEATTNHHPEIPIAVTGIDYAALDRYVPFADDLALRSSADALESAGLTPASARPMVGGSDQSPARGLGKVSALPLQRHVQFLPNPGTRADTASLGEHIIFAFCSLAVVSWQPLTMRRRFFKWPSPRASSSKK